VEGGGRRWREVEGGGRMKSEEVEGKGGRGTELIDAGT